MGDSFEERSEEIKEDMEEEGLNTAFRGDYEGVYENGIDDINMNRSYGDRSGTIILPNEKLALLWRKVFRVQFTDGGWQALNEGSLTTSMVERTHQMDHPFAYSNARIKIDESREKAKFESYDTHEKMVSPKEHFDIAPIVFDEMIYIIRLFTEDDDYDKDDLFEDLEVFEDMEFDVMSIEKCKKCNPELY